MLGDADVLVDFTQPDQALDNARAALEAGVHVVIGTTGFDIDGLRAAAAASRAKAFFAPNFAIGAVLMMKFAAEASRVMQRAEIIELHHPAKLDAPSGTAARTAEMMDGDVPIHSVRLPGIVADQEVILGDVAQTLTHPSRHHRPHELHARASCWRSAAWRTCPSPRSSGSSTSVRLTIAVTDHAIERYLQRVRGVLDARPEIAGRVRAAWEAGRVEPTSSAATVTSATSIGPTSSSSASTTARATSSWS